MNFDAITNADDIKVASEFVKKPSPEIRQDIIRHELTHANFRIINKNSCVQGESGLPYCNDSEKKSYSEAIADFKTGVDALEKRLIKALKNGFDINSIEKKIRQLYEL